MECWFFSSFFVEDDVGWVFDRYLVYIFIAVLVWRLGILSFWKYFVVGMWITLLTLVVNTTKRVIFQPFLEIIYEQHGFFLGFMSICM